MDQHRRKGCSGEEHLTKQNNKDVWKHQYLRNVDLFDFFDILIFFVYLDFLLRTFTIHRTVGKGGDYL